MFPISNDQFAGKIGNQSFIFKDDPFQIKSLEKNIKIFKGNSEFYIVEKSGGLQLHPLQLKGNTKNYLRNFDEIRFWNNQILARIGQKWHFQPGKSEELVADSFKFFKDQLILLVENGLIKVDIELKQKFFPISSKEKVLSPLGNFAKVDNIWVPIDSGIAIPERGKSIWWKKNILIDKSNDIVYIESPNFSLKFISDTFSIISNSFLYVKNKKESLLVTEFGLKINIPNTSQILSISDTQCAYKNKNNWVLVGISGNKNNVNQSVSGVGNMRNGYIKARVGKRFGLIDASGFIRIACRYDSLLEFEENLIGAKIGSSWGFLDQTERLKIQPNFNAVSSFKNGLAVVQKNEKYGLISPEGNFILNLDYDEITPFAKKGWLIRKGKWWGYATKNGKITISPRFFNIIEATTTLMKIKRDEKYGLISQSGKMILDLQYKFISLDQETLSLLYLQ